MRGFHSVVRRTGPFPSAHGPDLFSLGLSGTACAGSITSGTDYGTTTLPSLTDLSVPTPEYSGILTTELTQYTMHLPIIILRIDSYLVLTSHYSDCAFRTLAQDFPRGKSVSLALFFSISPSPLVDSLRLSVLPGTPALHPVAVSLFFLPHPH